MPLLSQLRGGVRGLFRKAQVERELDDEVDEYVATAVERYTRAGLSADGRRA